MRTRNRIGWAAMLVCSTIAAAEPEGLAPHYRPPAEFAGDFGVYRSPLLFKDGSKAKTAADWARRRKEISETWHRRLGAWPPLVAEPRMEVLETTPREGFAERRVRVPIGPEGAVLEGLLLVPDGKGPFPAVVVTYYEPFTSAGLRTKPGPGHRDYALQLAKRGFVALAIGTPGGNAAGSDTREVLIAAGETQRRQPLTILAYTASNCRAALAMLPEVRGERIGIVGLSFGGKWAMFASCLDEKFACAVWSDPGIVFDENNRNVNYWEPWYLGYDPAGRRKPGVPTADNPRTGLYKELLEAKEDLVDLHALMAPRPVLVSGGTEDPPRNWRALNHLVEVVRTTGHENRVALTSRPTHPATAEAFEIELTFLEVWLKR